MHQHRRNEPAYQTVAGLEDDRGLRAAPRAAGA